MHVGELCSSETCIELSAQADAQMLPGTEYLRTVVLRLEDTLRLHEGLPSHWFVFSS